MDDRKDLTVTDYLTEEEQIAQLKAWIKEYGLTIIAGIVLAIIFVGGWRYWDRYTNTQLMRASIIYDEMLMDRAQNDKDHLAAATVQGKKLVNNYARTPYAQMASLMLARDAAINKKYDDAIGYLDWVIGHSSNKPLKQIAKIRIARIYTAKNQPELAIQTLQGVTDPTFKGLRDEAQGDAYAQMKKIDDAKKSYQLALQELPQEDNAQRPILEMKLDSLS